MGRVLTPNDTDETNALHYRELAQVFINSGGTADSPVGEVVYGGIVWTRVRDNDGFNFVEVRRNGREEDSYMQISIGGIRNPVPSKPLNDAPSINLPKVRANGKLKAQKDADGDVETPVSLPEIITSSEVVE